MPSDQEWMELALEEAQRAAQKGEVPIGAVIVRKDKLLARAHNQRETLHDPTAHAEILALRQAAHKLQNWRLTNARIYVTLEPCPMCAGALILARVDSLLYGATDPKAGAVDTLYNLLDDKRLNHQIKVTAGVKEEESRRLLQDFFKKRRYSAERCESG